MYEINGFSKYEMDAHGAIFHKRTGKLVRVHQIKGGYEIVQLYDENGRKCTRYRKKLVRETLLSSAPNDRT